MHDALYLAAWSDDDEGGDFFLFHESEGRGCQGAAFDGDGMGVHDVARGVFEGVGAVAFEETSEIAVGDHAGEMAVFQYGGHAEFFAGHLVDDLGHGGGICDLGESVAGVHQLADAGETFADAATRMQVGEVFGLPATATAYFESESIAQREHDRSGGGGGEVERTGFGGDAGVEEDAAGLSEGGGGAAGDGDERGGEAPEGGQEAKELFGLAAVGEGEDGVAGGDHAHVAVDGFGGVEEVSGRAGGAKGRGDLAGDDAAFADAGEDDAAIAPGGFEELVDGLSEGSEHGAVEAKGQLVESGGLDAYEGGRAKIV